MKRLCFNWFLAALCLAFAPCMCAESRFAGALLSGRGEGIIAGNIHFTVNGGEAVFQSTLFQSVASGMRFEPVLAVQNKVIPFDYGVGTPGRFELGEFFGPIPGWDTTPVCGWEYLVVDPGFVMPWYWDGVRFAGSFRAFPGLENLLRARGGTLYLQMRGAAIGLQDPLFTALLVEGWPPRVAHFTAELSGSNAVPPTTSPFRASATFALTDNWLRYSLTWNSGMLLTFAGIFGPAKPHGGSTNLIADITTPMQTRFLVHDGWTEIIYLGAISLGDEAVKQLKLGKLYVNLLTTSDPGGEIRGQILPVAKADRKLNPK